VAQPYLELGPLNWGALVEADGSRYRVVGDGPADLLLRHVERGARVVIEYQGTGEGLVSSVDGDRWKLPAAPAGGSLTVELTPGVDQLTFTAADGVFQVTRLALQVPEE
jgi:hypothetical protein